MCPCLQVMEMLQQGSAAGTAGLTGLTAMGGSGSGDSTARVAASLNLPSTGDLGNWDPSSALITPKVADLLQGPGVRGILSPTLGGPAGGTSSAPGDILPPAPELMLHGSNTN
jgi:hypothetical protein